MRRGRGQHKLFLICAPNNFFSYEYVYKSVKRRPLTEILTTPLVFQSVGGLGEKVFLDEGEGRVAILGFAKNKICISFAGMLITRKYSSRAKLQGVPYSLAGQLL